jgi:hypothetical protein
LSVGAADVPALPVSSDPPPQAAIATAAETIVNTSDFFMNDPSIGD